MNHSTDRIITTHVGSLPRPDDLLALANDAAMHGKACAISGLTTAVAEVVTATD